MIANVKVSAKAMQKVCHLQQDVIASHLIVTHVLEILFMPFHTRKGVSLFNYSVHHVRQCKPLSVSCLCIKI